MGGKVPSPDKDWLSQFNVEMILIETCLDRRQDCQDREDPAKFIDQIYNTRRGHTEFGIARELGICWTRAWKAQHPISYWCENFKQKRK
ncbi:hypothetical protein LAZ67_3002393 [Cordylochernes scorpioides]|uniref:Transposase n=1 Tax=Cordylochernes scorpioides TaxID=51811 RepID=A0ABY6K8L7_9ARAC|nr:hypothetical protein LAZ67_3002393 [Cordylochernes scorpioides]